MWLNFIRKIVSRYLTPGGRIGSRVSYAPLVLASTVPSMLGSVMACRHPMSGQFLLIPPHAAPRSSDIDGMISSNKSVRAVSHLEHPEATLACLGCSSSQGEQSNTCGTPASGVCDTRLTHTGWHGSWSSCYPDFSVS